MNCGLILKMRVARSPAPSIMEALSATQGSNARTRRVCAYESVYPGAVVREADVDGGLSSGRSRSGCFAGQQQRS